MEEVVDDLGNRFKLNIHAGVHFLCAWKVVRNDRWLEQTYTVE
jgi:hypothetical protein